MITTRDDYNPDDHRETVRVVYPTGEDIDVTADNPHTCILFDSVRCLACEAQWIQLGNEASAPNVAELARRLDQLSADHVAIFEAIDDRAVNDGEDIDSDEDETRHQSIGQAAAFGLAAAMVREMFAEQTRRGDEGIISLEWIADSFAGMHRNENHRRAFLATIERDRLARYVLDEIGQQELGEAVASAVYRLGYEDPSEDYDDDEPTDRDETRTLEFAGVTVTIGTSSGSDGAALVIIDTDGEPDGSDGWKGLRVDVNDGPVFEGVPLVLDEEPEPVGMARPVIIDGRALLDGAPTFPTDGSMETAP